MSDARSQLRRLLAFLPQIADGEAHDIASVAQKLGVDVDTVAQDLHVMVERYNDPGGWLGKVQLFIEAERVEMVNTKEFHRPMRLTPDQWRATELGLATLRAESAPDDRHLIDSALAKVRSLISDGDVPDAPSRAVSLGAERHAPAIAQLRSAMRTRHRVEISYQKASDHAPERRTVCPFSFAIAYGSWYLVAHCDRSRAIRIFRLDRMRELKVLDTKFDPPAGYNVADVLTDGRAFAGAAPDKLRVRYSPKVARWMSERGEGTMLPDGSCEVEYPLADPDWALRHALRYGPEAEIISPASLRQVLMERLKKAAQAVAEVSR